MPSAAAAVTPGVNDDFNELERLFEAAIQQTRHTEKTLSYYIYGCKGVRERIQARNMSPRVMKRTHDRLTAVLAGTPAHKLGGENAAC